ncbi:hypothetical protein B296_00012621 [Ensete ventricosum]|uniref:Protein kinase domain-containing protein n=1 Tax=Ensete ventricosum TaxID=4639 RepID=A0A427APN6_ENSVE|nr:hypothetical protein B296_00012621 [Ensete ventricosum]
MGMNCFQFLNGEKMVPQSRKSASTRSNSSRSTDRDRRVSESDFNSSSDMSDFSVGRSRFPSLSQRQNNFRVFTFKELKHATRNFSRSLMIGEGGFGCVYRGTIQSSKDPSTTLDVAVKQLSRGGLQASYLQFFYLILPKLCPFNLKCVLAAMFDKCNVVKISHRLICPITSSLWEKDRSFGSRGLANDYGNLECVQGYTGEAIYLI